MEWTSLAFIGWTPWALAHHGQKARTQRALGGLMIGVLFGLISVSINPPEVITGGSWIALSLVIGLAAGLIAAAFEIPHGPSRLARMLGPWSFIWMPAMAWTGLDYLRLITTAGHQWGMLATTQVDMAPLRAFLPIAGMWPVTLLTVATGQAIAAIALIALKRLEATRSLGLAIGVVVTGWIAGATLAMGATSTSGPEIRVAAVQTGDHIPGHPRTRPLITTLRYPELTDIITELHRSATIEAAKSEATLVVWPEASGWVAPDDANATSQIDQVRELARRTATTIVWPYFVRIDPNKTRNEIVLVTPDGRVSPPTTKDHPVYVIGERSVTAGLHRTYMLNGVRIGLAAGPDGTYTDTVARLAHLGAMLVAIPTHDWEAFTTQHIRHLRTRAAEHHIAIVKADWRYGSVVIGPTGKILDSTSATEKRKDLLITNVRLAEPGSLYTWTGDWAGLVGLLILTGMTSASITSQIWNRHLNDDRKGSPTNPS
jgi:apolipoprotein N-acyltransferase